MPDRKRPHPTAAASSSSSLRRRVFISLTLLALVMIGLIAWCVAAYQRTTAELIEAQKQARQAAAGPVAPPLPEIPETPFLNVSGAHYVGSQSCLACHEDAHDSFRETGMGRSLAELDPDQEPPADLVEHPPSGLKYEIYYEDGHMRHREMLLEKTTPDGEPVVLNDLAIPYVVGSGRHSRSYLLNIEGFMVESPVTWYTSKQDWGMSPGYDSPHQEGFQRAVTEGCLTCHAGRAQAVDGSFQKMQITEHWISCERCHGPGSLHVDRHSGKALNLAADKLQQGPIDLTIVNQAHLNRELSESICAQCHLRSAANVLVRGQEVDDYRPGLPLSTVRTDYRLDRPETPMRVVGHVEQLRLSKCYQNSKLTCTTCHNPHGFPEPEQQESFYRATCLECHTPQSCGLPVDHERRTAANDNCMQCHMPKSGTEIPHLAFTHHRIGLHDEDAAAEEETRAAAPGTLVPLKEPTHLSVPDQKRSLGLAYLEFSQQSAGLPHQAVYHQRAFQLLSEAWNAGIRDAETATSLAQLTIIFPHIPFTSPPEKAAYIQAALTAEQQSGRTRANALVATAAFYEQQGEFAAAADAMREVTKLRRFSNDWLLLGQFYEQLQDRSKAINAFEKAISIDPMKVDLREYLVGYYEQLDSERADYHRQRLPKQNDSASGE